MSIFQGAQVPTGSQTQQSQSSSEQVSSTQFAPFALDYLTRLSQSALGQLPRTGDQLIAGQSGLTTSAYGAAPDALQRYTGALDAGTAAARGVAGGVNAEDISKFYNPYEQRVVDEMARQSAQNVQRNLLPQLKAGFVGSGNLGSQRYAGALGQTMSDVQADLLGQQAKARAAGYSGALDAALKEAGLQTQAAQTLGQLGATEQQAATARLKGLTDLGAQEQAYRQSIIEAPIARMMNIGQVMRGYPMQTSQSAGSSSSMSSGQGNTFGYGSSPLSQVAGLSALVGSMFGRNGMFGPNGAFPNVFGGGSTPTGYGTTGTNPIYMGYDPNAQQTFDDLMSYGGI